MQQSCHLVRGEVFLYSHKTGMGAVGTWLADCFQSSPYFFISQYVLSWDHACVEKEKTGFGEGAGEGTLTWGYLDSNVYLSSTNFSRRRKPD